MIKLALTLALLATPVAAQTNDYPAIRTLAWVVSVKQLCGISWNPRHVQNITANALSEMNGDIEMLRMVGSIVTAEINMQITAANAIDNFCTIAMNSYKTSNP